PPSPARAGCRCAWWTWTVPDWARPGWTSAPGSPPARWPVSRSRTRPSWADSPGTGPCPPPTSPPPGPPAAGSPPSWTPCGATARTRCPRSSSGACAARPARPGPLPSADELAAWTPRGLLAAVLDPMRRYREDWLPAVEQRLVLAEPVLARPERLPLPATPRAPEQAPAPEAPSPVPARVLHEGRALNVRRAWADDGRGLPLELTDDAPGADGTVLRAARLDAATGRVTVHESGSGPRLPGRARGLAELSGAVVVSHRPGKRAVVRTRDDDGTTRYVKIVRPGRSRRLLEAIDRAADFTGPFRTAQVLAADEDTVTFAALPGRLLHDGLPVTDGTWRRAWRETLDAWTTAVEASRRRFQDGASSSVGATGATGEGAAGTG